MFRKRDNTHITQPLRKKKKRYFNNIPKKPLPYLVKRNRITNTKKSTDINQEFNPESNKGSNSINNIDINLLRKLLEQQSNKSKNNIF